MKRGGKKPKSVVKGAPSGFMLSILIHVGAFALAGALVVFNVVNKEEKKFVPPKPVERPKMKLKKPKVKVKKDSKPRSSERIVTKVQRANMPEIFLPEMSGIGDGVGTGGGFAGFDLMPDLSSVSIFGAGQTIGNDFVGTFYDFKRDRSGNVIAMDELAMADALGKFVKRGWKPSALSRYYQSPKKLYSTTICVPLVPSTLAPFAFDEPDTIAVQWAVHYTGKLVCYRDIKFRFWGHGDDILIVGVDGKIVLDASWQAANGNDPYQSRTIAGKWVSSAAKNRQWYLGNQLAWGGDWIELKAGVPLQMDVVLGEQPGGNFCAMLLVEEEGVEYETNPQNQPLFPIFRTAPTTHDTADAIMEHLVEGEADVFGGPVFQDYEPSTNTVVKVEPETQVEEVVEEEEPAMRLWTLKDGKSFEAEFISKIGDKAVFRSASGKQVKIPYNTISQADHDYITLSDPPEFDVEIVKSADPYHVVLASYELDRGHLPPRIQDWTFGAKVSQKGLGDYPHELKLEYYAIGHQYLDPNKYRIIAHDSATFTPSKENKGSFKFESERPARTFDYNWVEQRRGLKYNESLVLLTDSRGKIIAHRSTAKWLWDNLDELRKRDVWNYINKDCERVYPTGPVQNSNLY
ncbi:hypothetical protein P4C99_21090 [Pontiellaceae bacterium B1224]|nr:hypothetical protein [Pontiellaceae bacterium B1224]